VEEMNFRQLSDLLSLVHHIRDIMDQKQPVARLSISAHEVYQMVEEVLDLLIFLISGTHYRVPQKNPGVKAALHPEERRFEGISNPMIRVKYPRYLTDAVPEEVKGLQEIMQDLITLDRNRRLLRASPRRLPLQKEKASEGRRRKRRGFFIE
jgi:hypothetical protein